jgi:hypothetical protein
MERDQAINHRRERIGENMERATSKREQPLMLPGWLKPGLTKETNVK